MSVRPRSSSPLQDRAFRSSRGFALLVTITLLAFLVVLLVGLASYTRIETAVAGNTQRQEQARQNALLGLNVALAQLQKAAGPDRRVTATAEAVPNAQAQKLHYTGVWNNEQPADPPVWLVSGLEVGATEDIAAAIPVAQRIELIGTKTAGTPNSVVATVQDIRAVGVPGTAAAATTTIGRYAWWVGDQGVKAPVAVPDTSATVNYAPFGDGTAQNELGKRLRQQLTLGAGAADATGTPVFEPQDANNAPLVANDKLMAPGQLAFLKTPANAAVGLKPVQDHFHAWSPNNFAVLANTKTGGLRQDLSLKPDLLGPAFTAWADYKSYMEDFTTPTPAGTPSIIPAYGVDPLRRRYKITPPATSGVPGVAPVLSYFYIIVGVRKSNANSPYTISIRWAAALWNPYSSALIPEDLRLEVSGLPSSIMINARSSTAPAGSETPDVPISLSGSYGTMKLKLPWTPSSTPTSEQSSWLPGRVYNWVSTADAAFPAGGTNVGSYASRDIPGLANGMLTTLSSAGGVNGSSMLTLTMDETPTLRVRLVRDSDGQLLADYRSPTYDSFSTTDEFQADKSTSPIGFIFRLKESFDTFAANPSEWLTTANRDPRNSALPPDALTTAPKSTNPTDCKNFITISMEERLLDRDVTNGTSYNEDIPLFELPRAPLLSLGELQHFPMNDARPFSIGNSWGAAGQLNSLPLNSIFDQFFLSGLAPGVEVDFALGQRPPNVLLAPLPRKIDGTPVTSSDLMAAADGRTSKFLLQTAAFNVNSVNAAAWASALRAVRFSTAKPFTYLDAESVTGTGTDGSPLEFSTANALFFRFPHSAQEVYKADDDYAQSVFSGTGAIINTPLFRRGVRALDGGQIAALATAIVANIKSKHADSGAFRSLEEFLNPLTVLNDQSVIEKAIADAGINAAIPEFSSQFLTQGDIMTALAPVLFPRSDTFVIRAYGEAVNPATNATEGRAWCEATVQRVPEYFDSAADAADVAPADLTSELNKTYGRRFKIVSFRWLTRSDI